MTLFREEVIVELKQQHYGTVLLVRPPSLVLYTLLITAVIAVFLCLFFTVDIGRKVVVRGVLVSEKGLIKLYPGQAALVLEKKPADGQLVAQGDELFVLIGANGASNRYTVVAPGSGVFRPHVSAGQHASPTTPIATIRPEHDRLAADLFVNGSTLGVIRRGAKINIRYNAFPFQKFGMHSSTVEQISDFPVAENDIDFLQASEKSWSEPMYKVRVRLDDQLADNYGKKPGQILGMRLEANIELERHKLYQWVIRPLANHHQ